MTRAQRPDVDALLEPLKDFQRRTVDYAFSRMYREKDPAHRFLIADEVGLGKTLVARGIIARAIDHLWDRVKRIDVVYICSSIAIAEQNLQKLALSATPQRASRLTMLPAQIKSLNRNKTNFIAFTPGTSFDLKSKGGQYAERVVLHQLLRESFEAVSGLRNLLQCGVGPERWPRLLADAPPLDRSLSRKFKGALNNRANGALKDEVGELLVAFHRRRDRWPDDLHWRRLVAIGKLRTLLAQVCIDALEPDLIILDEFQRFRDLLSGESEMSELARDMWNYATPDNQKARVLLLSATPYRMYSTDAEVGEDDHYEDFIATTRFLMEGDEARVDGFREHIRDYRGAIYRALHGEETNIAEARREVQRELSQVMVRTERVRATEDRSAMMEERQPATRLHTDDLRQWMFVDELSSALDTRDAVSLWKSAPYLPQFMGSGYVLRRKLDRDLD